MKIRLNTHSLHSLPCIGDSRKVAGETSKAPVILASLRFLFLVKQPLFNEMRSVRQRSIIVVIHLEEAGLFEGLSAARVIFLIYNRCLVV